MTDKRPRLTQAECDYLRELAGKIGLSAAARAYGCAPSTIMGLERRGWVPASQAKRAIPDDWLMIAPGRSADWLQGHYRANRYAIKRWLRESPVVTRGAGGIKVPMPDDFSLDTGETIAEMAARYGRSREVIRRWRKEKLAAAEGKRRATLAAMSPFERQMEKVRSGARLVDVVPLRRPDHAFTLGGVASGSLA